ncbi:MAG: S41 family peptidase [Bacteroidota bacterium]
MTFRNTSFFALIALVLSCVSCEQLLLTPEYENTPQGVFDALWNSFDQHYGGFMVKDINWDSMYTTLSKDIREDMSGEELFDACVSLLSPLKDPHVLLVPMDIDREIWYGSRKAKLDTLQDFDKDILQENYLSEVKTTDNMFEYGIMEGNIGYVYIHHFALNESDTKKEFDEVMEELGSTAGLIFDIRGGFGGEDVSGKGIASRFADQSYHYMNTRVKNGPEHDDFTPAVQWFVEPEGTRYEKPVVMLTNLQTLSARETFLLAMRVMPQVTQIGDTTAGGFSNANPGELPNGWGYYLSVGEWTDGNGISYEGKGIAPDILIQNRRPDVLAGKDEVLEKALEVLR